MRAAPTPSLQVQRYPLQAILDDLQNASLVMQCTDNADSHSIMAASQGIAAAQPMVIQDFSSIGLAPTGPYTRAGETQCRVDQFVFHQVASYNNPPPSELLHDTSGRCALDTASDACQGLTLACTPGANFFDLQREPYSDGFPNTVFSASAI